MYKRQEFKHLKYYYFHNFLYDFVWTDNRRRREQITTTWDLLNTYPPDYKVIIVGDAAMAPYEILRPGGSIEYLNKEAGAVWMDRFPGPGAA